MKLSNDLITHLINEGTQPSFISLKSRAHQELSQ